MKKDVLKQISFSVDLKYCSSLTLITIMTCYTIAVLKGHVPVWLPYISDCAVGYPEAYIFRSGMTLSSFFLFLNSYEFFLFAKKYNKGLLPYLSLFYSILSNTGFGILSVVNEKENDTIHLFGAIIFFAMQGFYMWNNLICIYYINNNKKIKNQVFEINNKKKKIEKKIKLFNKKIKKKKKNKKFLKIKKKKKKIFSNKSIIVKTFITTLYSADVIYLVINEKKEKNSAIYEWIAVILITIFNFSFILDYGKKLYLGIFLD